MSRTIRASRFYLVVGRGERMRTLTLRPTFFYAAVAAFPVLISAAVFGTYVLLGQSAPSLDAINADRAEIRAAYDDRVAALQQQMELSTRLGANQRVSLETEIRDLERRQQELDAQAATLGKIAQATASSDVGDPTIPGGRADKAPIVAPSISLGGLAAGGSPGQMMDEDGVAAPEKPQPEGVELRPSEDKTSSLEPKDDIGRLSQRLSAIEERANLDRTVEASTVDALAARVERSASSARHVLAALGLTPERFARATPTADIGGPFIPLSLGPSGSPLEASFEKLQTEIAQNQRIAALLPRLPVRSPLRGNLELTSPFGARLDPFLGRLALHPGDDLRASVGDQVHATAAGRVTVASYDGGYGNMVEIDHGDGLATRYGHLSEIDVKVGQTVAAGQVLGLAGSTGRSTGPHLHYEVRIDGQPVDPRRFLEAGKIMTASR